MAELDYLRDSVRSTRAQLKSLQKQLRTVIRFTSDLEERIEAFENAHSPKEGTANDTDGSREAEPARR